MFDLGESRTLVFETDREKRDIKLALPWCMLSAGAPTSCMRGVLGEGVRGARPPARRVEKIPSRRDLTGVNTDGVAISAYDYAFLAMFLSARRENGQWQDRIVWDVWGLTDGPMKGSVSILREYLCSMP